MKSTIRFLSSVKLAIFLLIIITIASILGTLIPQHRSTAEYAARYGQLSNVLITLEFTKLYQSWWYVCLLLLFSLNIVVCTLTRISPKFKRTFKPSLEKEKKKIQTLKISTVNTGKTNLEKTSKALHKEFTTRRYKVRKEASENAVFFAARKRMLGMFGSDIVHLGLLVIIIGGIISGMAGFRTNLYIYEGETLDVPQADFRLRLDKFETEYYPNGSVRDWKSTLSVIDEDKPLFTRTIEVNYPLSYKGFVFYQSSVGRDWENPTLEVWVKKKDNPTYLTKVKLRLRQTAELDEEDLEIEVLQFVPDFIIAEDNKVATRSLEPNNPAAFLEGRSAGEKVFSGWIFAKYPDFDQMHAAKEHNLSFELKNIEAAQYSGIEMAKDPGVNFIWLGCGLLMLGLFTAFFWPPREIKVILEKDKGKTEVSAGGIAAKNKEEFRAEFDKIMDSIRRPE
ncbi:MAG: cytochrome c biogenesis protein ResB [Candidatus Aminicenantes bacterium]|nr:cytochrome c biogenesis protein ResB [Candidatus Aminicenantes bacterium]